MKFFNIEKYMYVYVVYRDRRISGCLWVEDLVANPFHLYICSAMFSSSSDIYEFVMFWKKSDSLRSNLKVSLYKHRK